MSPTTIRLADVLVNGDVSYGIVQPGAGDIAGVPILRAGDIRNGRIDTSQPLRVSPAVSGRHSRTILRGGEILCTVVGSVGETALVPPELTGWNVARAVAVLNPVGVSRRWLHYAFQSAEVKHQIDSLLNTTVQPTLNLADLKTLQLPTVPLPEQQAIAEVLGALDDKIAANTRLAATAIDVARFEYAAALREDSTEVALGTLVKHTAGKYLAKDQYTVAGKIPIFGSNSLMGFHDRSNVAGPFLVLARIGSNCGILRWSQQDAWVNNNASALVPLASKDQHMLRFALDRIDMSEHRVGTGQPYIRIDSLMRSSVRLPSDGLRHRLSVLTQNAGDLELSLLEENRTLAATRDALLPKLMSGALRVRDAETIAEKAGA